MALSLRLPMGLGVEHEVNFEVNLYYFGQSDFLEIWGSVEPRHKSLNWKKLEYNIIDSSCTLQSFSRRLAYSPVSHIT